MKTTSAPVRISLRRKRRVPTENGGTKIVDDGVVHADAIVVIDFDGVAELLGPRAIKSKRGTATAMHGAIKLRVFPGSREEAI